MASPRPETPSGPSDEESHESIPRPTARQLLIYGGGTLVILGIIGLLVGQVFGDSLDTELWLVEPLVAVGGIVVIGGLLLLSLAHLNTRRPRNAPQQSGDGGVNVRQWADLTQQYFDTFGHDLGRPLRRILGKERELRARIEASGNNVDPYVTDLLDEIEQQAPSFRLMMANIQVLVELEDQDSVPKIYGVAPARIIGNIADRYSTLASEQGIEIAWWSEPADFGVELSTGGAIDHIVTNLVDNAVRYAERKIEIQLSKTDSDFIIRVWDDGPGIPEAYLPHVFERGWTPQLANQEERTSSGLGLHIASTLAIRSKGRLSVASITAPGEDHHTAFELTLPRSPTSPENGSESDAADR
ncbi:MAG: HAMP domain-containing histidine kinase [Chloroflexi bacterium]|nr:HAMP domain-containing histidine kinase [Chloroflexota bacterium]